MSDKNKKPEAVSDEALKDVKGGALVGAGIGLAKGTDGKRFYEAGDLNAVVKKEGDGFTAPGDIAGVKKV